MLKLTELNLDDPEGYTPFSRYVISQNFEMANFLLKHGADINFTNSNG
jgi:ankyrin repeat protein